MIGRVSVSQPGFPHTVKQLLEVMNYFGIDEALVYHSLSKESHPAYGNQVLLEEITHTKRLHGMWVLMPGYTAELPKEDKLIKEMLGQGIKAARVFPGINRHNFSLKDWCAGRLLRALEKKLIPLFIDNDEINWDTVYELCSQYPKLPIVLTNVGYRINRFLYPLLERFRNLHIEISGYYGHRGIEVLTERFGAERLLFGTKLPYFTPASAIGMLLYAQMKESDKRLIAGGNLKRLLGRVRQ